LDLTNTLTRTAGADALTRRRRWPARLDLLQSVSGLALAVFLILHSFTVGSLLFGPHVFESILSVTDGTLLVGRPVPALHGLLAATIAVLVAVHAALALRKFPEGYRQYRTFRDHVQTMRHSDTSLWYWQVVTGFLLFFLVTVHLYMMLTQPDKIGPVEATTRIVQGRVWLLYVLLTPIAQFHSLVGLYRLALKWGWVGADDPVKARKQLRRVLWPAMAFFIGLGLLTLASEIRVGLERESVRTEVPANFAAGSVQP
jgi:Succinate dehydrogenase/fumarate reductase, cytochrome b subunit